MRILNRLFGRREPSSREIAKDRLQLVLVQDRVSLSPEKMSELKDELPQYSIIKKKIDLGDINPDKVIEKLVKRYGAEKVNTDDGLRIDFVNHWVHFRKSNTEPIIRIIVEGETQKEAEVLADKYFNDIKELLK